MNPAKLLREVRQETSKVTWPSRRETVQTTVMVFVMVALVAVFFMIVDWLLGSVVQAILGLGS